LPQWVSLFTEAFISTLHLSNPQNAKTLVAFIDLPFAAYLCVIYYKNRIEKSNFRRLAKSSIATAIILALFIEVVNYAEGYSLIQFVGSKYAEETGIVQRYGTVVNSTVNIFSNFTEEQMIRKLSYGKEVASSNIIQGKPSFVVIQVESLDSNAINTKYKDKYIAPFLQSLSEKSVYYPYMLSYHKGGGTSDSEFSIINSIESLDAFPAMKLPSYDFPNSFVSRLFDSEYKTVAFHGNVGDFYNRDTALPKMGFQEFYDLDKMGLANVGWGAPDADVLNFAYDTLSNINQPFFSYLITMTSHGPFTNASNYYNNGDYNDILDETTKNYMNSISYVDQSLENFVTRVQANFKNTYVIIYGDHTPNVDTDIYEQASFSMDNKYFEFVPLIIVTPDNKQYRENNNVASFLDISPTILKASGIEFSISSDGQNLLKPENIENEVPFKEGFYDRKFLHDQIINDE